ncbi:unnamed protein product [Rotaria sp. Silwood1]|nr:unnamed protein product [Rotaria sp. Silwood1]
MTRIGNGVFPTELDNEIGEHLRTRGEEVSEHYGEPQRCGWLDLPLIKYASMINGYTALFLTKLDVLDTMAEIKVATGYKKNGVELQNYPALGNKMHDIEVEYVLCPGWQGQSTSKCRTFDSLPENARRYVQFIEKSVGIPDNNYGIQMMDVRYADDVEDDESLPTFRLSCFLHSLQLCVRDGMQNASYTSKVLDKCRILSKLSHKSSKIADALDQLNKSITKTNVTRWNSDYMLIKSILSIGKNDLESIVTLMENSIKFSNNDIMILQEIIDILEPFYDISIKCQSEKIVTASLVVPAIVHLMVHLRDLKEHVVFGTKLVQQLQLSIEQRFAGIVNRIKQLNIEENDPFNDSVYFIAAVLDPSFKFFWLRDLKLPANAENRLKQDVIQLILDEMNKDLKLSSTKLFDKNISSITKPRKRKIFSYDDVYGGYSNDPMVVNPVAELEAYLNDPIRFSFSEYWCRSQLIQLKKLVVHIGCVQASSAPIERVFSCAGLILSSRRTRLNETLFKDLVFLKANQALL